MLKNVLFIILCWAFLITFSQDGRPIKLKEKSYCSASAPSEEVLRKMSHYGNNQHLVKVLQENGFNISNTYLSDLTSGELTQIEMTSSLSFSPGVVNYTIPIKAWIHRRSNGTGGIAESNVEAVIERLNEMNSTPNNTGIRYYLLCDIGEVNNDTYFNFDPTPSNLDNMWQANRVNNALNMHFTQFSNFDGGVGSFPGDNVPYCTAIDIDLDQDEMENIAAHEVGHNLFLLHTHHAKGIYNHNNGSVNDKCDQESVNQSRKNGLFCNDTGTLKCEINGDKLCDTPADPNIQAFLTQNGCTISTLPGQQWPDLWGDYFTPSTSNIMSYSALDCISNWSPMQIGTMYDYLPTFAESATQISGPSQLCINENGTFSAPFFSGASYSWSVSGSGWSIVSGQGTSSSVIKAGSSSGTISVSQSCGSFRTPKTVTITEASITGPGLLCPFENGVYTTDQISGSTYTWTVPSGMTVVSGQGTYQATIKALSSFSGGNVQVSIIHPSCTANGSKYVYKDFCSFASVAEDTTEAEIEIFPNPVNNELNIKGSNSNLRIESIVITSGDGKTIYRPEIKNNQVDVSLISSGIYFFIIRTNDKSYSKIIEISR